MNMTPGWTGHVDGSVPMSPVILPMGSPSNPGRESPPDSPQGGEQRATKVKTFAFPAIPPRQEELSAEAMRCNKGDGPIFAETKIGTVPTTIGAVPAPLAIWPKCDCTEVVQVGVKLAEAVCCRLPPDRPSVLALTSPNDGDGKTTLAEILAPALARRMPGGMLVVDADFRRADLTARLAIPATSAPVGSSTIYSTDVAGLSVLPMSYQRECRGADGAWIEQMREGWPLVLLDMASLEHAETGPLLQYCDGVCLVVRLGHTARRAVAEAARVIAVCGGQLLGCMVVGEAA